MSGKDLRSLVKELRTRGYQVSTGRRSSHWQVRKGAQLVAVVSSSPSDPRSLANARAEIARFERHRP